MLNEIQKNLLEKVTELHKVQQGSVAMRVNGKSIISGTDPQIIITAKKDKKGLNIQIKKDTKNKSLHLPVLIDQSGLKEKVFNDFYIEDNCDIIIVAGCGIHSEKNTSKHNGIHTFHIGKNCNIQYIERHIGLGDKAAKKELSPITKIIIDENSVLEMETTQISGVSLSNRTTDAKLSDNSKLLIKEKVLTDDKDECNSTFNVDLNGKNSSVQIVSRAVAKKHSKQTFVSTVNGKNECFGHIECDAIIFDKANISSTPALKATNSDAMLSHEASIGKIAGEQIIKLMTLGLTEKEAEDKIMMGYLK